MKISFSTLGCPTWNLDEICRQGQACGYDGVDFRGYLNTLDITQTPEFTTQALVSRRQLSAAGLEVSAISSGITLCRVDLHNQNLEEARRTIAAAKALETSTVRVFGGGDLAAHTRAELVQVGRSCMEEILLLDGAHELSWLFETHDIWVRSESMRLLLDAIPAPFGALWDIGHTPRVGGETIQETYDAIGSRIGYIHIKDAIYDPGHVLAMEDGWRYVLPGTGEVPLEEAVSLLAVNGYKGWIQFEHEKRWHPNLLEPEIAIPAFANWAHITLNAISA